ncbi:MAG: DUF2115 domain-containing protein [Methanoregula sp.]|jgi:uncharacterized protein (UPF0305 family)|nr:DUF2115 domain-containing protein [Methanoregula sp.]
MHSSPEENAVSPKKEGTTISQICLDLQQAKNRGDLAQRISLLVLQHSPLDIQRMKQNFSNNIEDFPPEYRDRLAKKITEHLLGTYQRIRLLQQQGVFKTMHEPVTDQQRKYWDMAGEQCRDNNREDESLTRFLKYLLAGFGMLVLHEPGHPAGTPFPGGDTVQFIGGIYYCPVREKANDVEAALCPFCPALQTPEIGYLRPPVNPSEHRKQEFIEHCHKFHNFNG